MICGCNSKQPINKEKRINQIVFSLLAAGRTRRNRVGSRHTPPSRCRYPELSVAMWTPRMAQWAHPEHPTSRHLPQVSCASFRSPSTHSPLSTTFTSLQLSPTLTYLRLHFRSLLHCTRTRLCAYSKATAQSECGRLLIGRAVGGWWWVGQSEPPKDLINDCRAIYRLSII